MKVINADLLETAVQAELAELEEYYQGLDIDTPEQKRHASRAYGKIRALRSVLDMIEKHAVEI